jgi:GDP-D-mannose 3',5'-epimerase
VWGDGEQTRTFLYVDECVEGTLRLFESDYSEPVNIGSDEQVSINQMIGMIEEISGGSKFKKNYQLDKPKGVRGRSSNNDLVKKVLNWSYQMSLKDGLSKTYKWINEQINTEGINNNRFTKS